MRCGNRISFGIAALFVLVFLGITPLQAQNSAPDNSYYYVANTRPPDAFLALRTHPTSRVGLRIMTMPNGTFLQVLERRADGWWRVRVVPSGQEGWALSGQGNKAWIECCATASTNSTIKSDQAQSNDRSINIDRRQAATSPADTRLYTPAIGSSDRVAIMNAARFSTRSSVRFKVDHLAIAQSGDRSIAIAEIGDSASEQEVGGIFLFEKISGQWKALFMIGGGGGADACKKAKGVVLRIIEKSKSYNVPRTFFPQRFWYLNNEADEGIRSLVEGEHDGGCSLSEAY